MVIQRILRVLFPCSVSLLAVIGYLMLMRAVQEDVRSRFIVIRAA